MAAVSAAITSFDLPSMDLKRSFIAQRSLDAGPDFASGRPLWEHAADEEGVMSELTKGGSRVAGISACLRLDYSR